MIEALQALLFGLLIGSFLNVCIHRWPRDLSVVRPRSHCPSCDKMIAWYDNVPVLSYVLLGAKCRYCKAQISWRYPVVELMTGVLFFNFVYGAGGLTPRAAKMCVFSALLLGLLFADLEERILPDELTKGGLAIGFVFSIFVAVPGTVARDLAMIAGFDLGDRAASIAEAALGAVLPSFLLWAAGAAYSKIRHKEGLGFGDVKLIAMIGAFLGFQETILIWLIGSVSGAVLGFGYIKLTAQDPATYELPYGTFLCAAALIVAVFEHQLVAIS